MPTPLSETDWKLLAVVRSEYERARTIAARFDGVTEDELRDGDRSSQVASQLRKLHSHGLIERDYDETNIARCVYALSKKGQRELRIRPALRLITQVV